MDPNEVITVIQTHNEKGESCGVRVLLSDCSVQFQEYLQKLEKLGVNGIKYNSLIDDYHKEQMKNEHWAISFDGLFAEFRERVFNILNACIDCNGSGNGPYNAERGYPICSRCKGNGLEPGAKKLEKS